MSIGNEGEEKLPTHSELAALARDLDRQDKLAGKARGGANQARAKRRVTSQSFWENLGAKKLAAKYNGKKVGAEVVFGSEGETQFIFSPAKGRFKGAAKRKVAKWKVCLGPVPVSGYDTQQELSKYGRGLWNKEKGEPVLAVKAAEQLLACHVGIERLRKLHSLRLRLRQLLLWKLREKAKEEGVSSIEPDAAAQETLYTYPKPLVDTLRELREQLARVEEQLDTESDQRLRAEDAISLVVEALATKELGVKMQLAFGKLRNNSQWSQDITKLRFHALALASELQRPPTKAELRKSYDPDERMDPAQFSRLLNPAGLSWLPGAKSPRKLS